MAVARAAALIADGQVVAVPTETVYGLAADATRPEAVARIYAAKGRPRFNPLIVHMLDMGAAERLAVFDDDARALAAAFWPGPLTLVLPLRTGAALAPAVTAGAATVAIRVPAGRAMRALLPASGSTGGAVGEPQRRDQPDQRRACRGEPGRGGAADPRRRRLSAGVESTIVAGREVLRPGPIGREAIADLLRFLGEGRGPVAARPATGPRPSPGSDWSGRPANWKVTMRLRSPCA